MIPEDRSLTAEEAERSYERLVSEYREVELLRGWKLDLLTGLDVGIRVLPTKDVNDCVVCGFVVIPEELRKLWDIHVTTSGGRCQCLASTGSRRCAWSVVNLLTTFSRVRSMRCGGSDGIGKMISIPHTDLDDD